MALPTALDHDLQQALNASLQLHEACVQDRARARALLADAAMNRGRILCDDPSWHDGNCLLHACRDVVDIPCADARRLRKLALDSVMRPHVLALAWDDALSIANRRFATFSHGSHSAVSEDPQLLLSAMDSSPSPVTSRARHQPSPPART